jgi:glycosyltransferase involved in cell wall biosynthesis
MLAQRTLARWATGGSEPIATILAERLRTGGSPAGRARLVETLGLVGGAGRRLVEIAVDPDEPIEARTAAIAALGDRPGAATGVLAMIATGDDASADAARLALIDHRQLEAPAMGRPTDDLRVAQVHLGGRLDRTLAHAGEGDTGGVATLLVQLGDALAADPRIAAVTTIGRGSAADAVGSLAVAGGSHAVVPAPLGRHEDASFDGAWPALVAAERGLRRILRHRPATLLHLRMADVGSLAAARIARRHGLPFVFTLAPDPHAVIAEMERSGELDRTTFGPADARSALWFRARIVRHLTDAADQVVLFPRSELVARLRDLLGIDVAADPRRYHVVPEGIDPEPVRRARAEAASICDDPAPVVTDLRDSVGALGPGRRGLPLVVSVGRLTEMKGMARIVEAFAADERLRRRANLVIVGGDLNDPTPEERAEIDRIEAAFVECPELAEALVMLGHRPHDDVLRVLAIAEAGLLPWTAPGGAYACGSRKEEFGLAIVEALGIGLPVVAPLVGGPASYVEEGVTGRLVDTLDAAALAAGIHGALDLAGLPGRAEQARRLVEDRFTIWAMADALAPIYSTAQPARVPVAA